MSENNTNKELEVKKKYNLILILLMLVFAITFFIAYSDLNTGRALFGIGIPTYFENILVMIFSIAGIIRIIYEFYKE